MKNKVSNFLTVIAKTNKRICISQFQKNSKSWKSFLFLCSFLFLALASQAQYSYDFNYQAVVRNGAGALVPMGSTVSLQISIITTAPTGPVIFSETHSVTVNNLQGLVNLVIGKGTPVTNFLNSVDWSNLSQDKFLKIEVDPAGGTAYTNMGITKMQGVPYANHAFTCTVAENGTQWGTTGNDISYINGKVNVGNASPTGNGMLNVESASSSTTIISAIQTGASSNPNAAAIKGANAATGTTGIGVYGEHGGNGWGVYGRANAAIGGTTGIGVLGQGGVGMHAATTVSGGVAIQLDGFMKVSGSTKTAFKTPTLTAQANNVTMAYAGAANTDIVLITPISNGANNLMPSWTLVWNTVMSEWRLYTASDDGVPSNFPIGTAFNVMVIKQ